MNEYSVKKMSEYPVNPSPLSEDLIPTITVEGGKFVNRNIEFSKLKGDKGDTGPQGEPGDDGNTGASGKAATVEVGSVSTGPAGSSATVENTGDEYDAVLDFTIPKGDKGDQGDQGDPGVVQSVNGKSQEDVVLDTDDIADTATNRYTNDTDIARLADTSGENSGDQDLSGLATDAELTAGLATKEPTITAGTTSQYYRGDKTWQTLNTTAVGIPNVNNTSDMDKPVSTATQTALNLKANLASPALTGTPTAPTQTANNNSTRLATTAYVDGADLAHVQATDPHTQYMNADRGDARYAGQPYAVMAKAKFASLASSYGMLGKIFGNSGYLNDLQVYGESTQASVPTPDVPVPIVSTTGDVTVQSENKNLVKITRPTSTISGVTFTVNTDGTITANGTASANFTLFETSSVGAFYIPIYAGTTYTLSGLLGSAVSTYYTESVVFNTDNTQTYYSALAAPLTFTPSKNGMAKVQVVIRSGVTATNLIFKPQLEVAPAVTSFEKNTNSTQTLPLATTQLRSLPNGVSDRIYKSGSSWFLEQNVGQQVISGSETWTAAASSGSLGYTYAHTTNYDSVLPLAVNTSVMNSTMAIQSSFFIGTAGITADSIMIGTSENSKLRLLILTTRLSASTQAGVQAWLAANPVTIQYTLRTPITTPITDPTLITALENIRTYQGITNITASTPVSGSYGLDLNTAFATKTENATKLSKTGDAATGKMTFNGGIAIADNQNIELSATTGTRIGTSTTQKLGFYNATPVVRPTATPANATDLATAIALANNLKAKLIALGLIS